MTDPMSVPSGPASAPSGPFPDQRPESEDNLKLSGSAIARSVLDFVVGFPGGFLLTLIFSIPIFVVWVLVVPDFTFEDLAEETPIGIVAVGLIVQQATQLGVALFIQARGFGIVKELRDWKIKVEAKDILYGVVALPVLFITLAAVTFVVSFLLGVEESQSNTALISDNADSPWIAVIIFGAVVGAPIVEEILFRGLTLRIFAGIGASIFNSRTVGHVAGVVISSILFGLVHFPDGEFQIAEYLVVAIALGSIGAVLAAMAVYFDRLGPSIWAHAFFNMIGVSVALGLVEFGGEEVEAALSLGFW